MQPGAMAALVERLIGKAKGSMEERAPTLPEMERGHRPKRAIRNWRVLMDKLVIIIRYAAQQLLVQEWFPGCSSPLGQPLPLSKAEPATPGEIYAQLIVHAEMLTPLKSQTPASVAASACVHPPHALKGGGNTSQSYIYCKMCLCRWKNPSTATEVKKNLKAEKSKGPLSQKKMAENYMMEDGDLVEPPYGTIQTSEEAERKMERMQQELEKKMQVDRMEMAQHQEQMWKELQAQKIEMQEKEKRHQAALAALHREKNDLEREYAILQNRQSSSKKCLCGKEAEKLQVKREGPRKGRFFWKCTQRECQYFEWEPRAPSPPPSDFSFSLVNSTVRTGSQASVPGSRRRSKSPRTERRRHASDVEVEDVSSS